MSINIFNDPKAIQQSFEITYFQKEYLQGQTYNNFKAYNDPNFFLAFDIDDKFALSIPRSPFGSVISRNGDNSKAFLHKVKEDLKMEGVETIQINHPAPIYHSFIEPSALTDFGFQCLFEDHNQAIELKESWEDSIHSMQKRKLKSLQEEGFYFRKMEEDEWETAHKFLSVCRQAQGLQINISWDQLSKLLTAIPASYQCFGVFREGKMSAICISVIVNQDVAYYYLPATSPLFRTHSPMVLLIHGMVEYYRSKNFKFLDLGVSSVSGKPQETLMLFKERMGATTYSKPTFKLTLGR